MKSVLFRPTIRSRLWNPSERTWNYGHHLRSFCEKCRAKIQANVYSMSKQSKFSLIKFWINEERQSSRDGVDGDIRGMYIKSQTNQKTLFGRSKLDRMGRNFFCKLSFHQSVHVWASIRVNDESIRPLQSFWFAVCSEANWFWLHPLRLNLFTLFFLSWFLSLSKWRVVVRFRLWNFFKNSVSESWISN